MKLKMTNLLVIRFILFLEIFKCTKTSSRWFTCTAHVSKCMHITLWCTEQHGTPTLAPTTIFIKTTLALLSVWSDGKRKPNLHKFRKVGGGDFSKLYCMHASVICSIQSSVWVCGCVSELWWVTRDERWRLGKGRVIHISSVHKSGGGINAVVVVEMIQFPLQIGSHRKRFCLSFSFQFQLVACRDCVAG